MNDEREPDHKNRAIDLASNFIGEGIILSVAVLAVVAEQWRKNTGEQSKAQQLEERFTSMETRLKEVELALMSASREGGVGAGSGSTSSSESAQQLTSGTLPITSTTSTTQTSPSPSLVDRVWRLASKGASEKYDEKT